MREEFDNIWKSSFEEASISPSEDVWKGVVSSLDSSSGKRSWVTILLIAATVTVAFAFPLTVGNSEYNLKPNVLEVADVEQETPSEVNDSKELVEQSSNATSKLSVLSNDLDEDEKSVLYTKVNQGNYPELKAQDNLEEADVVSALDYQEFSKEPVSGLDHYYILPAYKRKDNTQVESLLAYGNINSGRQSASSGYGGMDFLASTTNKESTDFNSLDDRNNSNISEEGGATFYLGMGIELPVSRRLNLTAGLGYQNQRLNGSNSIIYEENGEQYPLGIYDPIKPGAIFLSENYEYVSNNQFVSLPLGIKYAMLNKKIKLRAGLGVSPDFMVSHKVSSAEYGTSKSKLHETDYNTIQLSGLVSLDVLFPLNSNYGLALETGLRQGMIPIAKDGSRFNTSLNFGVILFYQID